MSILEITTKKLFLRQIVSSYFNEDINDPKQKFGSWVEGEVPFFMHFHCSFSCSFQVKLGFKGALQDYKMGTAGLEQPAGARNQRKDTVKIHKKMKLRFLPNDPKSLVLVFPVRSQKLLNRQIRIFREAV